MSSKENRQGTQAREGARASSGQAHEATHRRKLRETKFADIRHVAKHSFYEELMLSPGWLFHKGNTGRLILVILSRDLPISFSITISSLRTRSIS